MPRRKKQFKSVPGMFDILPGEFPLWNKIEEIVKSIANFYNFLQILPPVLEEEELFIKGTGRTTEIVEKQMYSFRTRGGQRVVLRPEFTPSIIRAYIQSGMENLPKPVKLFTFGPIFRHERAQKGRYRQFWQFNFEIFGDRSPIQDALLLQLFSNILKELSLSKWELQVNSIGCKNCRPFYLRQLKNYYKNNIKKICPTCKKRLKKNPLRVLDCKEEKCQRVKKFAPQIVNSLCEECHLHLKSLLEILDATETPYILNPYIVRGLDYYEKTVFEFVPEGEKESALIGGGRYDNLIEELGGKAIPTIGGAGGVERIVEKIKEEKANIIDKKVERFEGMPEVFLVQLGELAQRKTLILIEDFKKNKIKVVENIGKGNIKPQLRQAAKMNVKYTLILGQKEVLDETIILRDMETGVQEIIPSKDILKEIKKRIKK